MTLSTVKFSLLTRAPFRRLTTLNRVLQSARAWTLVSAFGARGAGFTVSFFLSRFVGAHALGAYTALLNTASAVLTPYSGIAGNNATIMAAAAHRVSPLTYWRVARASMGLMAALSVLSFLVFIALGSLDNDGQGLGMAWAAVGGACVILGQTTIAVIQGSLYGAGRFVWVARVSATIALGVAISAGPVVWWAGVKGALALAVVLALLPSVILGREFLVGAGGEPGSSDVWKETQRRFIAGLATAAATSIDNGVNWACTIYLVRQAIGMDGVGVLGIAMQWHTAMLLPVVGWSGVTLKALTDASAKADASTTIVAVIGLAKRNLVITVLVAGMIGLAAPYLAAAYGLGQSDLALLIRIFVVVALARALVAVLELLMLCQDRQRLWLAFSVPAFALQAVVTVLWIGKGLWVVVAGILAATVFRGLLCLVALPRLVRPGTRP